jgi:thioredoxin reductase
MNMLPAVAQGVQPEDVPYDVAVVGGGPAGIAAALWAARYRRSVVLIDSGQQRNRWTRASHGYLGAEGAAPSELISIARQGLDRYREVELTEGHVMQAVVDDDLFRLRLTPDRHLAALRLVLATGVRDVFPEVDGFEQFFGQSIFTCPSCDGYEAQGKVVAVVGGAPEMADFATGLLDWAGSVVLVSETGDATGLIERAGGRPTVNRVRGRVVAIDGERGQVRSLTLDDGSAVSCEVVFWPMRHEQQSELPRQLGCAMSDGCVVVDDEGATTVRNVFAAGDMTPGPHLVQLAAAEGTRAGIAAATSLRGERGSPLSPTPAPEP